MRQMQELRDENERLRAQVDLLKRENDNLRLELLVEIATNAPESAWGDLGEEPEPHDAASAPEPTP